MTEFRPLVYSIPATGRMIGLGRTSVYNLIADGVLDARKAGGKTVVTADSIERYVAGLPRAEIHLPSRSHRELATAN